MFDFSKIASDCQRALVDDLIPFWLRHACDGIGGGYFDYLTATGQAIEADKQVARQAEQVWAFAYLYTTVEADPDWLDHAQHGADFLAQFAHTDQMACYTRLDRMGQPIAPTHGSATHDPLTGARVASAYAQMHLATADDQWAMLAKQTLHIALRHYQTAREKALAATTEPVALRHLSWPVALLRALLDARPLFTLPDWKEAAEPLLDEILNEFLDKRQDILREWVLPGGAFSHTPEGRRVSTGLTMETTDLLIDVGVMLGNRKLILQAMTECLRQCQWAWQGPAEDHPARNAPRAMSASADVSTQGLVQWVDWKDLPVVFADANHRLASVHGLALAALANGYLHTRHPDGPRWLHRVANYAFGHFSDPRHKAWHMSLSAQNQLVSAFKTTADNGCYALIRGLASTWQYLEQCAKLQPTGIRVASH
ncbi:AGE family epimerase/isomerase [Fibrella sp. HMF5335]|uniref:AGE family epimerase/isomerase n=1 Tax=Fibrella rubiginis TaxID=2817060 RepID=A0A939K3M8_9BACT|nr:AGE family epimerase/isomerase [Fibrella rubiginis]MBO0937539.1 AGE family epimerase/isomerase [Fibrella rubiginis]